jgi:hypothetical protein
MVWKLCKTENCMSKYKTTLADKKMKLIYNIQKKLLLLCEISGSHSGKYEDGCFLGCCVV